MQVPIEIVFSNIDKSDAVENLIKKKVERLEKFYHDITSCHIYLNKPHKHKEQNYEVGIEVRVPGAELAARTHPNGKHEHADINIAIRDSFNAIEKQLAVRKQKSGHRRHTALVSEQE